MKTAIIGMGRMGIRHLQAAQQLDIEIVGICDQRTDPLLQAEVEYGTPVSVHFTDTQKLLEEACPDFVIIATTAPSHASLTCLAAEAGAKYILCEKPMAVSLAQCDQMIETCRRHGTKLAINHGRRFLPHGKEMQQILSSSAFGKLSSMTVVGSNMGIAMNGVHFIELFHYLAQETSQFVTAWFSAEELTNPRGAEFKDRAGVLRLDTKSGKRFYMDIGDDQGHGIKIIYTGVHGQVLVDERSAYLYESMREEEYRDVPTSRYAMPGIDTQKQLSTATDVAAASRAVINALLNDGDFPTGEEGRATVEVLTAAYVSNEENHRRLNVEQDILPADRIFPWA